MGTACACRRVCASSKVVQCYPHHLSTQLQRGTLGRRGCRQEKGEGRRRIRHLACATFCGLARAEEPCALGLDRTHPPRDRRPKLCPRGMDGQVSRGRARGGRGKVEPCQSHTQRPGPQIQCRIEPRPSVQRRRSILPIPDSSRSPEGPAFLTANWTTIISGFRVFPSFGVITVIRLLFTSY